MQLDKEKKSKENDSVLFGPKGSVIKPQCHKFYLVHLGGVTGGVVSATVCCLSMYCWFCLLVTAENLFRRNITKHTMIATVATEVTNEIIAIAMAATVGISFRYVLETGVTVSANELENSKISSLVQNELKTQICDCTHTTY